MGSGLQALHMQGHPTGMVLEERGAAPAWRVAWGPGGGKMVRRGSAEAAPRRPGLPGCRERPEWVWVWVEVAEGP